MTNPEKSNRIRNIALNNQKLALLGYIIPIASLLIARKLNLASFSYNHIYIFIFIILFSALLFYLAIRLKKNITKKYADIFLILYFLNWSFIYWYMTFFTNEIRFSSLIFAFIALIFLLSNATFYYGIILTFLTSFSYLSAAYVGIKYYNQSGSIILNIFFTLIFIPVGIFTAYTSNEFRKYRESVKAAKKDAEEAKKKIENEKNDLKTIASTQDEFLSNISHELRTPLSTIYGYAEIICDDDEKDLSSLKSYSQDIYNEAEKLMHYIDDLMLITNIESKPELHYNEVLLADVINNTLSKHGQSIKDKNISTKINIQANLNITIDEYLFNTAMSSIIKNAILFNKDKGSISIKGTTKKNSIEITIEDTGIGISQNKVNKIWDKFYRVDTSLTYSVSGVGIGLFLAKRIIELHEGTISAESIIDKGTTIKIVMPIYTSKSQEDKN